MSAAGSVCDTSFAVARERRLLRVGMSQENATQVVLRNAVDAVGGTEKLAASLGISLSDLDAWIAGNGTPPQGVLMHALELATYQAQLKDLPKDQRRQ
jgi:hypothetical protein